MIDNEMQVIYILIESFYQNFAILKRLHEIAGDLCNHNTSILKGEYEDEFIMLTKQNYFQNIILIFSKLLDKDKQSVSGKLYCIIENTELKAKFDNTRNSVFGMKVSHLRDKFFAHLDSKYNLEDNWNSNETEILTFILEIRDLYKDIFIYINIEQRLEFGSQQEYYKNLTNQDYFDKNLEVTKNVYTHSLECFYKRNH